MTYGAIKTDSRCKNSKRSGRSKYRGSKVKVITVLKLKAMKAYTAGDSRQTSTVLVWILDESRMVNFTVVVGYVGARIIQGS